MKFEYLPLDKIDISISNARKTNIEEGIDELTKSIEEIEVQQPVVVFEKPNKRYELIIGQRRYLACKKIGLKAIPALITTVKDKTDATIKSFIENIHRLDLEYRDKMQVAIELLNKFGSVNKVSDHIGVSPQTVRNYLGYAGVEEDIKKMVDEGKLSPTTALLIARNVPDEKRAVEIAKRVKEIRRSDDRKKVIYAQKENPDKPLEEVVKIAKRQKLRRITIDLTPRTAEALDNACQQYKGGLTDMSMEDLAKNIAVEGLEEWLKERGFLK